MKLENCAATIFEVWAQSVRHKISGEGGGTVDIVWSREWLALKDLVCCHLLVTRPTQLSVPRGLNLTTDPTRDEVFNLGPPALIQRQSS